VGLIQSTTSPNRGKGSCDIALGQETVPGPRREWGRSGLTLGAVYRSEMILCIVFLASDLRYHRLERAFRVTREQGHALALALSYAPRHNPAIGT
jgi:hypothetical protein